MKGDTVWTVSLLLLAAIGKLFNTGKYNMARKIAVTGPKAIEPAYVDALPGINMADLKDFYDNSGNDLRFVSGDVLTGENVGKNGSLGFSTKELKEKFSDGPNLSDSANSVQATHTSHGSALRRHTIWTPTRMAALAHS